MILALIRVVVMGIQKIGQFQELVNERNQLNLSKSGLVNAIGKPK